MNKLYLVRHGENLANLTKEFSYRYVDYSLTPKGRLQAQQTAAYFRDKSIHEIYSSPLKRAIETAAIIGQELGVLPVVMENFREINVGDLELEPVSADTWERHNRIFFQWIAGNADLCFPGGEDYHSLWQRLSGGIRQIIAGKSGRNIIVVGHGGIFSTTLKDLCPNLDLDRMLANPSNNCSITEIDIELVGDRPAGKLVRWSSYDHLSGEAAKLVPGFPTNEDFR